MAATQYSLGEQMSVVEQCSQKIQSLLQEYYEELEELREAVNDRWPWPDLFLRQEEVDSGKILIQKLLTHLEIVEVERKEAIKEEYKKHSP